MKKLIVWLLVLCMSLCLTAIAEEGGNFSDEMKFDDGCDLSPEDGADSVERLGDHPDSPYFNHLDFYHMTSTDTLTILTNFKTIQQSSEWSCGVASALMTLEWYGLRGDYTEETLASLRSNGTTPEATSLSQMIEMFEGVGGFTCYSAIDAGEDVYDIFTFDYIQETLAAGNPIMIGWNDWADTGRSSLAMTTWAPKPRRMTCSSWPTPTTPPTTTRTAMAFIPPNASCITSRSMISLMKRPAS